eukprot:GHUV01028367.1.p1 GENE.GHUV01028367.1~~GHUV01028367.1.p1  ORF type:complete len:229 (+),score=55.22 GHUV01028367.1:247-933(+)
MDLLTLAIAVCRSALGMDLLTLAIAVCRSALVLHYTSKLVHGHSCCRKAYRLGKFLQDVNSARKMKAWTSSSLALLELVAYAGEGTYYFLDQFLWLMKAGFIPKHNESSVSKVSAWAEVVGYAANIILSLNKYQQLVHQEQALARKIDSLWKDSVDGSTVDPSLTAQLSLLRSARLLRLALIVQDLADSMTAINDITGGRYRGINHPVLLACAGLVSAAVSSYKYWGS